MSLLTPSRPAPVRAALVPAPWLAVQRALIARGLRDNRRAPLTWGLGLGSMSALMTAVWPSIEGSVDKLMKSYPEGLKRAFGIRELNSVEKYVDAEMLSLIAPLALAFFAVRCAVRATVGAEERGHLDTLLSLPVSRRSLVVSSWVVTAVMTAVVLAVIWASTWVVGTLIGTGISATVLGRGVLNVWPLAMAFAGLAVLAAGIWHRQGPVTGVAIGALIGMYVIDLVGKIATELDPLRVISAFRYYGSAVQEGLDWSHVIGLTLAGIVLTVAGALLLERRDIL